MCILRMKFGISHRLKSLYPVSTYFLRKSQCCVKKVVLRANSICNFRIWNSPFRLIKSRAGRFTLNDWKFYACIKSSFLQICKGKDHRVVLQAELWPFRETDVVASRYSLELWQRRFLRHSRARPRLRWRCCAFIFVLNQKVNQSINDHVVRWCRKELIEKVIACEVIACDSNWKNVTAIFRSWQYSILRFNVLRIAWKPRDLWTSTRLQVSLSHKRSVVF